jgi:hypothetical protein
VRRFGRLSDPLRPALEGFRAVADHVERAKGALTDAVPTTRLPGRPFAEALQTFDDELAEAAAAMPAWRVDELEDAWLACASAIEEARGAAERVRLAADPPAGFEALIGTIGDLLAPLEAFTEAAERFRFRRRRR